MKRFGSFLLWYLPVLLVQAASGLVTANGIDSWYRNLQKPIWNPPNWVFGPVWTLLYLMMALALAMVAWSDAPQNLRRRAYTLFFAQLLVNGLWTLLFFGMQRPDLALIDLALLVCLIAVTARVFYQIRPLAAWLLAPYLIWTAYALSLNAAIWWLN